MSPPEDTTEETIERDREEHPQANQRDSTQAASTHRDSPSTDVQDDTQSRDTTADEAARTRPRFEDAQQFASQTREATRTTLAIKVGTILLLSIGFVGTILGLIILAATGASLPEISVFAALAGLSITLITALNTYFSTIDTILSFYLS